MARTIYLVAAMALLTALSFVVVVSGVFGLTLVWAVAAGAAATFLSRLIAGGDAAPGSAPPPLVMAAMIFLFGTALKWASGVGTTTWMDWAPAALAVGSAWGVGLMVASRNRTACFVCKTVGTVTFVCPRCHQTICAQPTCWSGAHLRCRYCEEREVILFPIAEGWWQSRVGARASTGACSSCFKESQETDLRECGQCQWPMCKRCWDFNNGHCTHCDWVMPNLPPDLHAVSSGVEGSRSGQQGRRPRA
jgi:hypothetical protein